MASKRKVSNPGGTVRVTGSHWSPRSPGAAVTASDKTGRVAVSCARNFPFKIGGYHIIPYVKMGDMKWDLSNVWDRPQQ